MTRFKASKLTFPLAFVLLLFSSPWFLSLLSGKLSLKPSRFQPPTFSRFFDSLSFHTSTDFLFFTGDGREGYGTGDHGVFLLSFLPYILLGAFKIFESKQKIWILWFLVVGLLITATFTSIPGLVASLWFLPAISLLATKGFLKSLRIACSKEAGNLQKGLIFLSILFLIFETLRLYQVIILFKPYTFA